jgi:hypothetical protein
MQPWTKGRFVDKPPHRLLEPPHDRTQGDRIELPLDLLGQLRRVVAPPLPTTTGR